MFKNAYVHNTCEQYALPQTMTPKQSFAEGDAEVAFASIAHTWPCMKVFRW